MKVFVRGLEFQGFQGVSASERDVGHRFRINLVAEVRDIAEDCDDIVYKVDYAALAESAVRLCRDTKDATLESACSRIGKGLLAEYELVDRLIVSISKVHPAVPLSIEEVGVEEEFLRPRER